MHRLCPIVIAALLVGAAVSNAVAQPAAAGIVSSPCPSPAPAAEDRLKPIDDLFMTPAASPEAFWAEFAKLQATVLAGTQNATARSRPPTGRTCVATRRRTRRSPMARALAPCSWATRSPTTGYMAIQRCSPTASSVVASAARRRRKCWHGSGRTSSRCDRASCTSWLAPTMSPGIPVLRHSRITSTTSWR